MADKGKGCGCIGFVFVGIIALSALTQCFGGGSGSESSKPSESSSQADKVIVQTTEVEKTTTSSSVELEFKDKELNIYYERPTGTPSIKLGDEGDAVGWVQCAVCKALNTTLPIHCHGNQFSPQVQNSGNRRTINKAVEHDIRNRTFSLGALFKELDKIYGSFAKHIKILLNSFVLNPAPVLF